MGGSSDGTVDSRLCFMGYTLMENGNGLFVDCELTGATGTAGFKVRGLARPNDVFTLQMIASNLVRIPRLLEKAV